MNRVLVISGCITALVACASERAQDPSASSDINGSGKGGETSIITPAEDSSTAGDATPPVMTKGPNPLPAEWPNNGSLDCVNHTNSEPTIYKFQYDANTFILRENKCLNYEANFIYVIFGNDKVLVQDTGSIPRDFGTGAAALARFAQVFPIRNTIESIIGDWLAAHPNADGSARTRDSMELLVTHSHSHGDHVQGDYQFRQADGTPFPHTRIAGYRPADVATFFGITGWPNSSATIDLGGRKLDVLPIPGHEAAHIAIYDHGDQLLLSGDSLYPGHIFVNDWTSFRASVQRLNTWIHEADAAGALVRPVAHVFGTHIEKSPVASQFYPYPSWVQDPERKLELTLAHVELLAKETEAMGVTSPHHEIVFPDFAVDPQ